MYESKSSCDHCSEEFYCRDEDRDIAENKVCMLAMNHYNSDNHRAVMIRINGRKLSKIKSSTSCGFCGKKFEISLDLENDRITDDVRRNMERVVVQDVVQHMFSDGPCKTMSDRQNKIETIIDEN